MMQKDWSDPKNRVVGHVVWAPPITGNTPPHGYTQDVCVIKLDKDKFMSNFVQNVINLGSCRARLTRGAQFNCSRCRREDRPRRIHEHDVRSG